MLQRENHDLRALLRRWQDFGRDYFSTGTSPDLIRDTDAALGSTVDGETERV
jgi:hypothetical protein